MLKKLEFFKQILEKYSNIEFNENPGSGSRVVQWGRKGRTDITKTIVDFRIQIRSKDSQVKTQLVSWIFILFKATMWQHVSASTTRPSSSHK